MNEIDTHDLLDIKLFNIIENEILTDIEKEKQLLELAYLNNVDINKIYQRYFWLKQMDINPNVIHLRENHKIIYEIGKTSSELSDKISKDLKKKGMTFVGTTIIYAYLQAIGIVNSHDENCFKYKKGNQNG